MSVMAPLPLKLRSRRYRRIAWTVFSLLGLAITIAAVTWRIRHDNAPEEYEPGEVSADITDKVSERGNSNNPPATLVAATLPSAVAQPVSSLRNPGRALPAGAPAPRFTDVTQQAGLADFRQFAGSRTSQLPEDMGSGLAWGDFDNDGLDDLFVVSGGGALDLPPEQRAPSVLYHNLGNGRFERVKDFPELRILGMGAAWGDYNNDGWLDLVVTGYDTIILFRNDHGHLVREKTFPSPKGFWTGVSWGDYNRDGFLDLYVCGYVKYIPGRNGEAASQQFGLEVPYTLNPASYEPERNLLFRNNGDGTFTEVAHELGVDNPDGRSLSVLWHDFDGDGWPDLYVANDISENKLYLNRHGKFVDAGKSAWVEEYRGSMGLAAGDFDRDGDDDLFISHWIAQGDALYQSLLGENKSSGSHTELHFTDVGDAMGVASHSMQTIGWGTSFVDVDSDGWPDLLVANGSTFEDKFTSPRKLVSMPSFLFWNAKGTFFHDLAPWNISLSQPHVSRGLAVADFNNDGAMDVAIVDNGEGVRLLRNDIPQGNWAEFRLHSRVPGSKEPLGFGDGVTVIAWVNGIPLRRTVGSSSYLSQDSHRLHFGLGRASKIDRLEVRWLRGASETWTDVEPNQIWDVTQGEKSLMAFAASTPHPAAVLDQATLRHFWDKQHAAMDAMKRENNLSKAIALFREALQINPDHEDSHYYLANCLAATGDIAGAIAELDKLAQINPQNHRAYQRKGELLAAQASNRSQLEDARKVLNSALKLNSEETGTLILRGEVEVAIGDLRHAEDDLTHACQANPRASNAWFLRGYVAWKQHDAARAEQLLAQTKSSRGPNWKPVGAVLEGDVKQRMYSESGFLSIFADQWNGYSPPAEAYASLSQYLKGFQ